MRQDAGTVPVTPLTPELPDSFNMLEEVVLQDPVPSSLLSLFTTERPSKRRKTGNEKSTTCDVERGTALLPGYLAIASCSLTIVRYRDPIQNAHGSGEGQLTVKIALQTFDESSGTDVRTDDGFEYDDAPLPIILRMGNGGRDRLRLSGDGCGVVLDQAIDLNDENRLFLQRAQTVGSIYSPSVKSPPPCCSQTTLRKIPGQLSSFQLHVRLLWKDSLDVPMRLSPTAADTFSKFVPPKSHFESQSPTNGAPNGGKKPPPWNPSEFYDNVHVPETSYDIPTSVGIDSMPSRLLPFQRRSVRWLLEREGVGLSPDGNLVPGAGIEKTETLPTFVKIKDLDGNTCYASHLFRTVTTDISNWRFGDRALRGGILAEEMGLGKTLELLSLIFLHRRPHPTGTNGTAIQDTNPELPESGATLIITPPAILEQWKQEIQAHAPDLQFVHYKGIKNMKQKGDKLIRRLASSDIVLTTYSVLRQEVHYAEEPPERSLRNEKRFERPKSPLVQIYWWRVCIDEAQMIETGVNNAARVARIIPRHNAWAVTGTPLRKDMNDLYGLFLFLKYEPFCYSIDIWSRLCQNFKPCLKEIIGKMVLRHNKTQIRDELQLPPQKRVVITVPFTAVEEQNYDQLFQHMCDECGLELNGAPAIENWDPNSSAVIERMRSWLSRLRQACLHAEVDGKARKAFGANGPLRSVSDVLEVMIDQNDAQTRVEERSLLLSAIRRGQLMENALRPKDALKIWQDSLARCEPIIKECRSQLESVLKSHNLAIADLYGDELDEDVSEDDGKAGKVSQVGKFRQRLRSVLEVQHICKFFIASAYYQIKSNEELTAPESEEYHALEKLEEDNYEAAKLIRREMLAETNRKVNRFIHSYQHKFDLKNLAKIPNMSIEAEHGGIESRKVLDRVEDFCDAMNSQAEKFTEWRKHMSKLVLQSLIDEEDGAELQGDEYEVSTKHQDEMYVYMEALRVMFAERHDSITGQTNILIAHEVRQGLDMAKEGQGPSPELYIKLMEACKSLRIPRGVGSLRDILSDLRSLVTSLEGQEIRGSARARTELAISNDILQNVSRMFSEQTKASSIVEREVELFRDLMNKRLEYYRQLQQISDTVAPYDEESRGEPLDTELFELKRGAESKLETKISSLRSKHRYLIHLRDESGAEETARICIICQSSFEIGVLTVCGHKYCKDCLRLWWKRHRTCPTCKNHLRTNDFHQISYKSTDLLVQQEKPAPGLESEHSHKNSIYEDISSGDLQEIKNIDIRGSFGTKIDTLARHLIWLRQHDPGAKSIVFSQYKPFLTILASAFSRFKIGFTSVDSRDGIEQFKQESSIECFLLHAKAHSSGLNLVNATHVFLCEPLINTAIELQAIARVHRIGQHRETTVWMYLVSDSVEESIYEISVARRLAHIAQKRKEEEGQSQAIGSRTPQNLDLSNLTDNVIESANTLEMQDATLGTLLAGPASEGERVKDDDLWQCLFGKMKKGATGSEEASEAVQDEVGRLLRAGAAETRRDDASSPNGV